MLDFVYVWRNRESARVKTNKHGGVVADFDEDIRLYPERQNTINILALSKFLKSNTE